MNNSNIPKWQDIHDYISCHHEECDYEHVGRFGELTKAMNQMGFPLPDSAIEFYPEIAMEWNSDEYTLIVSFRKEQTTMRIIERKAGGK